MNAAPTTEHAAFRLRLPATSANIGPGFDAAAVALGRMGGKARAAKLSPRKRRQIAKNAASARWGEE